MHDTKTKIGANVRARDRNFLHQPLPPHSQKIKIYIMRWTLSSLDTRIPGKQNILNHSKSTTIVEYLM